MIVASGSAIAASMAKKWMAQKIGVNESRPNRKVVAAEARKEASAVVVEAVVSAKVAAVAAINKGCGGGWQRRDITTKIPIYATCFTKSGLFARLFISCRILIDIPSPLTGILTGFSFFVH